MDGTLRRQLRKLEHDFCYQDTVRLGIHNRNLSDNYRSDDSKPDVKKRTIRFELYKDGSDRPSEKQRPNGVLWNFYYKTAAKLQSLKIMLSDWIFLALLGFLVAALSILVEGMATLNVHTSATMHAPEIRTGDHFVLSPYKLLEPAYLKAIRLYQEQGHGSYLHVLMFDPISPTETMQLYYDRPSRAGKVIDLEEPIADGGFISKKIFNANPMTNIENPNRPGPNREFRKLWIVLVFKTVSPLTRLYISVTVDLHAKYKTVTEFLKSETGRQLGTPVAGTFFYLTAD